MNVVDLQDQVEQLLAEYGKQCSNVVNEAVHDVSKEALKKLKKESPNRTGLYKKGWKVKKNDDKFSANDILYGNKNFALNSYYNYFDNIDALGCDWGGRSTECYMYS